MKKGTDMAKWCVCVLAMVAAVACVHGQEAPDLRLPHVFGSNMVLQREMKTPVWGWAAPGDTITVSFAGQVRTGNVKPDGTWRVDLDPLPASAEPRVLQVAAKTGNQQKAIENVLVGEVWLCSGQSNMQWSVRQAENAKQEIADATWPLIRHFAAPRRPAGAPQDDIDAAWQVCSPETVGGFTAVGYFFGRELHRELDVPVGLLHSSWGGTRIEPWTPPEGFGMTTGLEDISERVGLTDPASPVHQKRLREYIVEMEQWVASARKAIAEESTVTVSPTYPAELSPLTDRQDPSTLFNGMIFALIPYAFRGAVWYQGESNRHDGAMYARKMEALIRGWRGRWQREFPFYYVQIAPFVYNNEPPFILPRLWEAQASVLALPQTGMVVTNDIGNVRNIHPANKQDVGRRLAAIALAQTYGKDGIVWSGPTVKSLAVEGSKLRVLFDHVGGGLVSRDGKPLSCFEVAGKTSAYVKAEAVIDGDSVIVSSPAVAGPVSVRFAWHRTAEPNLMNKAGLPAGAFRAGPEPAIGLLAQEVPDAGDYELVYELDLAKLGRDVTYDVDRRAEIAGPFDRIAYFLELHKQDGTVQYVFVAMDAFTDDLAKIGIPVLAARAQFQQTVDNLDVCTNVGGLRNGQGMDGGNIEFWPNNYSGSNAAKVPGASDSQFDFGDQCVEPVDGHGSMQVHNHKAKQTIFSINKWRSGAKAEIGIGNSPGQTRDWTFVSNADTYPVRKLQVLVRLRTQ